MGLIAMHLTSKMFITSAHRVHIATDEKNNMLARISWKRSNLLYSSVLMGLFLVVIVEWSFWGNFGAIIWEAIIFMKILSIFAGSVVDKQLGEALLSAPVMTAMGLAQGIVTMSANDFMDFLLSYVVGFGFLILERMYIGPLQADVFSWVHSLIAPVVEPMLKTLKSVYGVNLDEIPESNGSEKVLATDENTETLEPLLGSFASYSCDTLSLLYTPFIMVVITAFRDEAEITKLYGIKEADMEYYILFAMTIIPFQFIADIFIHNALELLHGWKMQEYLEYCRYRFVQREVWWKGLENTEDDCIEESLRSVDLFCFSSQYYMLNTIHVNALIYFVIGIEMMTRANYNLFGDPAMFPIVLIVFLCCIGSKLLLIWVGRVFGVWRIRHEKRGWHEKVMLEGNPITDDDQLDDFNSNGHNQYQMEKRISSDTFRYKFLRYNRPWLINQLPNILTPRITQRSRPYMINQLARVLGSMNADISSDSEDEDPDFETPPMSTSTRSMLRRWLKQADRLLNLRKIVQPIIQQSRGSECEVCLSRNLLQVETYYTVEEM